MAREFKASKFSVVSGEELMGLVSTSVKQIASKVTQSENQIFGQDLLPPELLSPALARQLFFKI